MTPDDATDALTPLAITCTDWTDDKFALWVRMVADECDDVELGYQASSAVVRRLTNTFVPAFSVWRQALTDVRNSHRRSVGWNAIGSGRGISLAEHVARLQQRTDIEARVELARWREFAEKFPRSDLFGSTWRTALDPDRQEPAA